MRLRSLALLLPTLLFTACTVSQQATVDDSQQHSSSPTETSSSAMTDQDKDDDAMMENDADSDDASALHSSAAAADRGTRIIDMTVSDWEFNPATITATVGEKVIVRLTDTAGTHSFGIADLGINVPISPGQTQDVTLPTDKPGTYEFRCFIPCGPGHREMKGTLVIS